MSRCSKIEGRLGGELRFHELDLGEGHCLCRGSQVFVFTMRRRRSVYSLCRFWRRESGRASASPVKMPLGALAHDLAKGASSMRPESRMRR